MKQSRRNPLDKEFFLEGNKQKWCAIFTAIGLALAVSHCYGVVKDPEPFLQYFLSIGVTFILGASASDVMKSWKTGSFKETINETKTLRLSADEALIKQFEEKYANDLSYRPINPNEQKGEAWR